MKKGLERVSKFSEEKKEGKQQYDCECNKNLSENQEQRLVEYRRNY